MPIAKGDIGSAPGGIEFERALQLTVGETTPRVAQFILAVLVHDVGLEPIADEQVFIAVEVYINKNWAPTPIRGRYSRHQAGFSVRSVRPAKEQSVPVVLRPGVH